MTPPSATTSEQSHQPGIDPALPCIGKLPRTGPQGQDGVPRSRIAARVNVGPRQRRDRRSQQDGRTASFGAYKPAERRLQIPSPLRPPLNGHCRRWRSLRIATHRSNDASSIHCLRRPGSRRCWRAIRDHHQLGTRIAAPAVPSVFPMCSLTTCRSSTYREPHGIFCRSDAGADVLRAGMPARRPAAWLRHHQTS